jgi:hypothetical protein
MRSVFTATEAVLSALRGPLFFPLILSASISAFAPKAPAQSAPVAKPVAAPTPEELSKVPDEFFVGQVPELSPLYGARASWFFWRPPFLWAQGELLDFRRLTFPQWDKNQVPLAISPAAGVQKINLILESADGTVLEEIPMNAPFVPDRYTSQKPTPARYRFQLDLMNGRARIQTQAYPWIQRKTLFDCEHEIEQGEDALQDERVITCLSTLDSISQSSEKQWFASVTWPETGNALRRNAISARDRELRAAFRKANHVYETERKGRKFSVRAGLTSVENLPVIAFDAASIARTQSIIPAAEREQPKKQMFQGTTAAGGRLWVYSLASDEVEQAALRSPAGPVPRLHIQFVTGTGSAPKLVGTEYLENRTGVPGFLRRWKGKTFMSYHQLTSSRGEESDVFGGPGVELAYAWDFWSLEPYTIMDTGLFHPGSDLSVSEFQVGLRRNFSFIPDWSYFYVGFNQYQLSGQNPGSSRLGFNDAIAYGVGGLQRSGKHYVQGRAGMLTATANGFDSQFEYGQIWHRKSDFHLTWGVFVGFSRYAGTVTIPSNRTTQNLSEDRLSIGFSLGFLGPEN